MSTVPQLQRLRLKQGACAGVPSHYKGQYLITTTVRTSDRSTTQSKWGSAVHITYGNLQFKWNCCFPFATKFRLKNTQKELCSPTGHHAAKTENINDVQYVLKSVFVLKGRISPVYLTCHFTWRMELMLLTVAIGLLIFQSFLSCKHKLPHIVTAIKWWVFFFTGASLPQILWNCFALGTKLWKTRSPMIPKSALFDIQWVGYDCLEAFSAFLSDTICPRLEP